MGSCSYDRPGSFIISFNMFPPMPEADWPSLSFWLAAIRNRLLGLPHPNNVPPKNIYPK